MRITLISPFPDITNFGLRTISAYLKESGHKTRLIFLPDPYGDDVVPDVLRYDDHILDIHIRFFVTLADKVLIHMKDRTSKHHQESYFLIL